MTAYGFDSALPIRVCQANKLLAPLADWARAVRSFQRMLPDELQPEGGPRATANSNIVAGLRFTPTCQGRIESLGFQGNAGLSALRGMLGRQKKRARRRHIQSWSSTTRGKRPSRLSEFKPWTPPRPASPSHLEYIHPSLGLDRVVPAMAA